jgi:parallel beta-helix repeat protein
LTGKFGSLELGVLIIALVLNFSFNIQTSEASFQTIRIKTDGSTEPANAPIQRNGNLYVLTANIKVALDGDGLVIDRDNTVLDGAGHMIIGERLLSYPRGICISGRENVTVRDITVNSFYYGIFLNNSRKDMILRNRLVDNSEGIRLQMASNNSVLNNTIETNKRSIAVYYSSNDSIAANRMYNNSDGVLLFESTGCDVSDNDLTLCDHDGICLVTSSGNSMIHNNITDNLANGIRLDSSPTNHMSQNSITANNQSGIVLLDDSNGNMITHNNLTVNGRSGIEFSGTMGFHGPSECTISDNDIVANAINGISLFASSNNTIARNLIAKSLIGVRLAESSVNLEVHNNFIDNANQTSTDQSPNFWNNSAEGNYWDTYGNGDSDEDGIGDSPFRLGENNTDFCPLMSPYIAGDVNHDAKLNIIDIDIIARSLGTEPLYRLWNPHADVDENGRIDVVDIAIAARKFGEEWKYP